MGDLPGPDGSGDRVTVTKAELVALREENARLRGLLGLDDRSTEASTQAWTPTLFTVEQATPLGDVAPVTMALRLGRSHPGHRLPPRHGLAEPSSTKAA